LAERPRRDLKITRPINQRNIIKLKLTNTPVGKYIATLPDEDLSKGYTRLQAEAKSAIDSRRLQEASCLATQGQWYREEMERRQAAKQ